MVKIQGIINIDVAYYQGNNIDCMAKYQGNNCGNMESIDRVNVASTRLTQSIT